MAITAIDLDGHPWMVCEPEHDSEIDEFIDKAGVDRNKVAKRAADPRERAKLAAEKALKTMRGENPDKLFGISL